MFFVERALGMRGVAPERLTTPPSSGGAAKLSFYFDYSSPWAYVGFMRLGSLVESVAPVQVRDDEIGRVRNSQTALLFLWCASAPLQNS